MKNTLLCKFVIVVLRSITLASVVCSKLASVVPENWRWYQNRSPSRSRWNWSAMIVLPSWPTDEPGAWSSARTPTHRSMLSTEPYNDWSDCCTLGSDEICEKLVTFGKP